MPGLEKFERNNKTITSIRKRQEFFQVIFLTIKDRQNGIALLRKGCPDYYENNIDS